MAWVMIDLTCWIGLDPVGFVLGVGFVLVLVLGLDRVLKGRVDTTYRSVTRW